MKPIVVAFVLSLVGVGRALAADLPLPAPLPPASYYPAARPVNWSGVYLGINGGYGFGRSDWTNAGISTGNFNTNGGLVGGTLGINYASNGGFLFGVEGDFDWSGLSGSSSIAACAGLGVPAGVACETKSDWLSTARFRAGYAFEHLLFFATGGGAIGQLKLGVNPPGNFFNPTPQFGWTAGGGIEYAFTDFLTAKIEYLYVNLGTALAHRILPAELLQPPRFHSLKTSSALASTTNLAGDRTWLRVARRQPIRDFARIEVVPVADRSIERARRALPRLQPQQSHSNLFGGFAGADRAAVLLA